MEESDPIEDKFRSSFSDFEKEPPAAVWANLHKELHPVPKPGNLWQRIIGHLHLKSLPLGVYLAFGGISGCLVLGMVYLDYKNHSSIRGHAYAGDLRLHSGSAELFQVDDKTMPWDSATYYRSAIIESSGDFQFTKIAAGNYILRIAPERNSETAGSFQPSWFENCTEPDSCRLIEIRKGDVNVEAHLMPKK
ncbi:MAG: hypothetical protein ACOYNC_08185 [Bacteroidales bacterium]